MVGCNATCVDTLGSYKCKCSAGFQLVANRVCTNEDECETGRHGCDQICFNGAAGYTCSCYTGYKLAKNNRTCLGNVAHYNLLGHSVIYKSVLE